MKIVAFVILCVWTVEGVRMRRQIDNLWWENIGGQGASNTNLPENEKENSKTIEDILKPSVNIKQLSNGEEEKINIPTIYEKCHIHNRICVPYTQCNNGKIISDGFGILTTGSGVQIKQHSECPLYFEVCCEGPDLDITGKDVERVESHTSVISEPKCGQRNYQGLGANVGRLEAEFSQFGEFPWMTAILKKESIAGNDIKIYICGGSLIFPNVILTAAHCMLNKKPDNIIVRAGEWDTRQKYEPYQYQERQAATIIDHPIFNPISLTNDFSLIILKEPFTYAPHVAPICLPNIEDKFEGQVCHATGWGKEQFGEKGTYQNVLKNVDLEVVSNINCEKSLKKTRLGKYFELHNTFTCAGGKAGKDTCGGDGGSPLVCKRTNSKGSSYVQAGIVAWGIGCGENGVPGVYADVRQAVDWIKRELTSYQI